LPSIESYPQGVPKSPVGPADAQKERSILTPMARPGDDAELARMLGLTGDEAGGFESESQSGDRSKALANPPAPMRLSRTVWLIAGLLLVAAVVFFMVVANSAGNS
jgi:hypothetical protein